MHTGIYALLLWRYDDLRVKRGFLVTGSTRCMIMSEHRT